VGFVVAVLVVVLVVATPPAAHAGAENIVLGAGAILGVLVLLLLEADELVHLTTKVLAGGQLGREADGVGAPLAAGVGLGGTPGVDRPEVGRAGLVLEGDDGGGECWPGRCG